MKLYPQLNFGGNCEEAFLFYEKNLQGKITAMMKQSQLPPQYNVPPGMEKAVVHARMNLAKCGTDWQRCSAGPLPTHPQRVSISHSRFNRECGQGLERTCRGGEATMPIAETFFATRFGQLRDKFGVLWSIIHPKAM